MNGKCSICESEHGEWVDTQHKAGLSTREIAKALEAEFGLSVSHVTVASHLNHGDKSDSIEQLKVRVRNLERWMSQALPGSPFVTWVPKFPGPGEVHHYDIRDRAAYLMTIENAESLEAEVTAIRTSISAGMDRDEAGRGRQQKEAWAREKAERDRVAQQEREEREEAQKKARDEAKRIEIEKMREEVNAFDKMDINGHKCT